MEKTPVPHGNHDIRSMFDRLAPRYDRLNHVFSCGRDIAWRRRAITGLDLPTGSVIVDLCGGTGALHKALLEQYPRAGYLVFNIDLSEQMLKQASLNHEAAIDTAPVCAQALQIPLNTASADAILMGFGLRNIPDRQAALMEIARVLKPGGRFVLLEFASRQSGIVSCLFRFYFHRLMPLLAEILGSDRASWNYLPRSVQSFLPDSQLIQMLEDTGMQIIKHQRLTMGICNLFLAAKRTDSGEGLRNR